MKENNVSMHDQEAFCVCEKELEDYLQYVNLSTG